MEGQSISTEDISARMMRRARCLHESRYSTDASDNVRMLEEEKELILAQERQFHLTKIQQKKLLQSSSSSKESMRSSRILTNLFIVGDGLR